MYICMYVVPVSTTKHTAREKHVDLLLLQNCENKKLNQFLTVCKGHNRVNDT
jgi:hypothetical protein